MQYQMQVAAFAFEHSKKDRKNIIIITIVAVALLLLHNLLKKYECYDPSRFNRKCQNECNGSSTQLCIASCNLQAYVFVGLKTMIKDKRNKARSKLEDEEARNK